jgi:hypothetical protein
MEEDPDQIDHVETNTPVDTNDQDKTDQVPELQFHEDGQEFKEEPEDDTIAGTVIVCVLRYHRNCLPNHGDGLDIVEK